MGVLERMLELVRRPVVGGSVPQKHARTDLHGEKESAM
jgi:hypothetical protein